MDTADHIYSSPDRLILVGGGSFNKDDLIRNARNADVIAVDGGLHACQEAGITPCAVIGDMDSAGAAEIAALGGAVPIHHIAEQDSTDLEKAMQHINAPLCLGFGFLGRRFDHALASLTVLARMTDARPEMKIVLAGRHDALTVTKQTIRTALPVDTRYSVWPVGTVGFDKSDGLIWPLDGLTLSPHGQVGTSNRTAKPAQLLQPASDNSTAFAVIVPVECLGRLCDAVISGAG